MPIVLKSGSLNLLEPSGPVQACNGIGLPLPFYEMLGQPTTDPRENKFWNKYIGGCKKCRQRLVHSYKGNVPIVHIAISTCHHHHHHHHHHHAVLVGAVTAD
jgi:hypothetical protein